MTTTRYDDAYDENNVLRDGGRVRVSMLARDAAMSKHKPLITDGTNNRFGLHKPGWRIPTVQDRRAVVRDAYETYETELCSRWQTDGDVEVEIERERHNSNNSTRSGSRRTTVEEAYKTYDSEISQAYRRNNG
jgi:hypothetical protein